MTTGEPYRDQQDDTQRTEGSVPESATTDGAIPTGEGAGRPQPGGPGFPGAQEGGAEGVGTEGVGTEGVGADGVGTEGVGRDDATQTDGEPIDSEPINPEPIDSEPIDSEGIGRAEDDPDPEATKASVVTAPAADRTAESGHRDRAESRRRHGEPAEARTRLGFSDLPEEGLLLRDPAHKVCPRAIWFWTVEAILGGIFVMGSASIVYFVMIPEQWWWATALYVLLAVSTLIEIAIKPSWKYAVHRWEITELAVYTRKGWLSREQRIAPLSRVQTVDSKQGALMRLFRIASITVTTASAAGPITVDGLDQAQAERVVAELTAITGAIEGDAT